MASKDPHYCNWRCYDGYHHVEPYVPLTPSADLAACRDADPATPASLAACYPDPPEYQHPEDDDG